MNPVIEGLRGIGALMVLVHHYTYQLSPATHTQFAGLHFFHNGVELFFVLTGFLFAPFMLGEKLPQANFFKRRFFRLYPVYFLSLLVIVFGQLDNAPEPWVLLQHLLLIQTLPFNSLQEAGAISLVYWTLSTELQFYVFLVVLAAFYRRVNVQHKMRFLLLLSVAGFLVSSYYQSDPHNTTWVLWQAQLPALLIEFFFGVVVYRYRDQLRSLLTVSTLLILSSLLLIALYYWYPVAVKNAISPRPFGLFNLLSALGYAGVFASLLVLFTKLSKLWACIWVAIGSISYPLYLFHGITLASFSTLDTSVTNILFGATLLALLIAFLVHKIIEIPCREYGRR